VDGEPGQIADPGLDDRIAVRDCSGEPDPAAAALAWMRAYQCTPFDLAVDSPIVTTVLRLSDQRHLVYTRAHHLALDGYGAIRLQQLLAQHYEAALAGTELPSTAVDSTAVLAEAEQ
ncbi:condensation domain-containing protein, partial [Nocardia cyriacigeorgica]|uniref:condensation domain-containing protein n=1 Tax=Nocardia cyriacigeorgica TaxID=135487 RepID=UPI001E4C0386